MADDIQILGLDEFDELEINKIQDLANKHYDRIKRDLPGKLVLHGKKHNKEGKRCMFSFHAKIQVPNNLINVKDSDWDLAKALHKTLGKVENQVQNKFKTKGK